MGMFFKGLWSTMSQVSILLALIFVGSLSADEPAQRIVALSPHSVELLFELGAGERIVATTNFADYPEAARSIPQVGGYNGLSIESILALRPDLIIAWEGGNPDGDLAQLERLGLKVYRSQTKKVEDIAVEIKTLGQLTGLESVANEKAAIFLREWRDLKVRSAGKKSVRFFYQLWDEPLRTIGAGSWINEIPLVCGGENVFDDKRMEYPQVSIEQVLKALPEVIIVPTQHGTGKGRASLWEDWQEIPQGISISIT